MKINTKKKQKSQNETERKTKKKTKSNGYITVKKYILEKVTFANINLRQRER